MSILRGQGGESPFGVFKKSSISEDIVDNLLTLIRERDALQRQQSSLAAEAFDKKRREFQAKLEKHDRNVASKRQTLERSNAEALQKIQETMLKIITQIAKDRKSTLVFQRSELVLFDHGFDVTDGVLQKLDEELPTVTVNFVAPAAGSGPSDQPAPAAATQPAPKKKK